MSAKARKLIKQAIQAHLDEDGASDIGAYRDVVTEVLHLAFMKFKSDRHELEMKICEEGSNAFEEELELVEFDKLNKIPSNKLPLHSINEFEFKSVQDAFERRLKEGPHGKVL